MFSSSSVISLSSPPLPFALPPSMSSPLASIRLSHLTGIKRGERGETRGDDVSIFPFFVVLVTDMNNAAVYISDFFAGSHQDSGFKRENTRRELNDVYTEFHDTITDTYLFYFKGYFKEKKSLESQGTLDIGCACAEAPHPGQSRSKQVSAVEPTGRTAPHALSDAFIALATLLLKSYAQASCFYRRHIKVPWRKGRRWTLLVGV